MSQEVVPLWLLCLTLTWSLVRGHGSMMDPISRNSLWRIDSSAPANYDDTQLFCGGLGVSQQYGGKCGVCGDSYGMKVPRPHETGGFMATNRTVKNYFPGSTMDIVIDLATSHGGYFEFEICQRNSFDIIESEQCFTKLKFVDGSYRKSIPHDHSAEGLKTMSLMMPEDLRECRACVLRWNYHAGNNWGKCPDGTTGMGCGPQELYRNCADISIGYQMDRTPDRLPVRTRKLRQRWATYGDRVKRNSDSGKAL